MPFDSAGNYSLVATYKATSGQTIRTEQHNPVLEDISAALSSVLIRDGRNGMTGALAMGGFKITNMAAGTADTDAATVGQIGDAYGQNIADATEKATPVDADFFALYDSAASNSLRKLTWGSLKTALAPVSVITDALVGRLQAPANGTYTLALSVPFGFTISEVTTKCESGSCTATFKINSTALGGTANAVSTTEQSQAITSANTGVAGDDIQVTISANSSCVGMSFRVKYTRELS
ncbi:MAG: hypothetical protein ACTHJQ_12155 [Rhizobiaceae bacterium]